MSYSFTQLGLVYPTITSIDRYGNRSQSFPSPWSRGYRVESKAESVKRVKPANLLGNLTSHGGHSREHSTRSGVSFSVPQWDGGVVLYTDVDPFWYSTVGQVGLYPAEPDWQTKLRLAVKDQQVNLAQSVAEYPQAQRMFTKNATTIANSLRSLRRGDMKGLFDNLGIPRKKLRGTVSNRWLEVQYGWIPLLSDLHGVVGELQQALQRPRTRRIRVTASSEAERKVQNGWIPHLQRYGQIEAYAKTSCRVTAYLQQESLAASRLGLTNPVNLAWELLPYSFVIDWFIPIGNWLNSLDAGIGLINISGTVSTKAKYIATNQFGSSYYMTESWGRSVFHTLPSAPLPTWKPSVGWKQVANALALLSQLKR